MINSNVMIGKFLKKRIDILGDSGALIFDFHWFGREGQN